MVPCPIADEGNQHLSHNATEVAKKLDYFVVERLRTARRFLASLPTTHTIDDIHFYELEKKGDNLGLDAFLGVLLKGKDVGVLSEAGCPGIADPGNLAVRFAHRHGISVRPLVGPSSILLALIASGFNGQHFTFHGYLPNKKPELTKKLRQLEQDQERTGATQIFMEAPYRNEWMLTCCVETLKSETQLSFAVDLNSATEFIKTQKVGDWKKVDFSPFHKRPAIFLIG